MFRRYVERGLLAGSAGGLAFGLFVAVVGNPLIHAVEGMGHGHHGHGGHEAAAVSAATTNLVSIGGGILWGLLLGAIAFGVVYYFLEPAIPGEGTTKRYVLAAAGFVSVSGAPWLVLPPLPPGVETALDIRTAMALYGVMVLAGVLACLLAGYAYDRLRTRGVGVPLAVAGSLVPLTVLVAASLLVSIPVAGEVPAAMATAYRGVAIFGQAMLWIVLASVHAWLGTPDIETPPDSLDHDADPASLSD